jgi:hypothetical protein
MKQIFTLLTLLTSTELFSRGVIPIKRDDELAVVYIISTIILIVLNYIYSLIRGTDFNKNNMMGMAGIALILTIIYWIIR